VTGTSRRSCTAPSGFRRLGSVQAVNAGAALDSPVGWAVSLEVVEVAPQGKEVRVWGGAGSHDTQNIGGAAILLLDPKTNVFHVAEGFPEGSTGWMPSSGTPRAT